MLSRRSFLAGSLPPLCAAGRPRGGGAGGADRRWALSRAVVPGKLSRIAGRSCRCDREEQALRHCVGVARLPVLPRDASCEFRPAGHRGFRQSEFRHSPAQHHRRAQGDDFDGEKSPRSGWRKNMAFASPPRSSFFPSAPPGLPRASRESARLRVPGLSDAGRFSVAVPIRARERLREGQLSRLREGHSRVGALWRGDAAAFARPPLGQGSSRDIRGRSPRYARRIAIRRMSSTIC